MQTGLGFWASKTLLSAVEMEVFTELAKQPEDLDSLTPRPGLHPRSSRDAGGMLEMANQRLFRHSADLTAALRTGQPKAKWPMADRTCSVRFIPTRNG